MKTLFVVLIVLCSCNGTKNMSVAPDNNTVVNRYVYTYILESANYSDTIRAISVDKFNADTWISLLFEYENGNYVEYRLRNDEEYRLYNIFGFIDHK